MKQSDIAADIFAEFSTSLEKAGDNGKLFTVAGTVPDYAAVSAPVAVPDITDICQTESDKTGERIVVEEKLYELPAQYEIALRCSLYGNEYETLLKAFGEIAVYFKDNPCFEGEAFVWHGSDRKKVFIMPEIRRADSTHMFAENRIHCLQLNYRVSFAVNSRNGIGFKRVEKRDMHSNVM